MRRQQARTGIDYQVDPQLYRQAALRAYEELNTPRSLTCALLLKYGETEQLARLTFDPMDYNTIGDARGAWVPTELLRKFRGLPGVDSSFREKAARTKADEAEIACSRANARLLGFLHGEPIPARVARALVRARRKVHDVLPEYKLQRHLAKCRWGPGSDALNKRPFIGPYHKFRSEMSFTRNAREFVACLLEGNHLWGSWLTNPYPAVGALTPLAKVVKGNSYLTVPKSALIDRSICVEPGANVYLQLGLGHLLRRALKRGAGIDLASQERNRWLALEGSELSNWATIDLSSASDTIARRLVQYLFSYSSKTTTWFVVMDRLRSLWTKYPGGEWRLNHKFSSMGNGFTFELETLVFWSIVSSVADQEGGECAAVYGDDIIISPSIYPAVVEVLEWCGFSVNTRKSYHESYFRESCGMNAWNGYELPSYRLEELENLADIYSFHNGLVRLGLIKTARWIQRRIPGFLRFFGPSGAGDAVLHDGSWNDWKAKPHGVVDQWFFWAVKLRGLEWQPVENRTVTYEPAILHSLSTLVPLADHSVYTGGRWGSEGLVTLSTGEWTVGEILISREALGLKTEWPPL